MTETTMNVEQQALACLRYLASQDADHAAELNGVGFNGTDTTFGHSLASQDRLSPKQLFYACKLLQKYRGQLQGAGLTVPPVIANLDPAQPPRKSITDLPEPPAEPSRRVYVQQNRPLKVEVRLRLIKGKQQIALHFSSYPGDEALTICKATLKKFKGEGFDRETKEWLFNLTAAEAIALGFPNTVWPESLKVVVAQAQAQAQAAAQEQADSQAGRVAQAQRVIAEFQDRTGLKLFDYQTDDILKAVTSKHHGAGLFYRRGAGKTLPALLAAKAWGVKAVVITTNSAMTNWQREADRAGEPVEIYNWASQPKPEDIEGEYVLIADESHKLQTWAEQERSRSGQPLFNDDGTPAIKGSQRTFNFLQLAKSKSCKFVLALTGTPFPNGRARELYATLFSMGHWIASNKWEYEKKFCNAHRNGYGHYEADGMSHADELRTALLDCCAFRGKAKNVTLGHGFHRSVQLIEPTPESAKLHDETLKVLQAQHNERLEKGEIMAGAEALIATGQLRHAASMAKIEPAVALARGIIAGGDKVLLFTQFIDVADEIVAALNQDFVSPLDGDVVACRCGQITGSVDGKKRQPIVDKLTSGEYQALVNVFGAAQEALNIQAASTVILVDRTWVPGDADQAEGRIDRIGQEQDVESIWLQYGPIDQKIDELLIEKVEAINKVMIGTRKTMRGVNESSVEMAREVLKSIFEQGE